MPSEHIVISEQSISTHPNLEKFLSYNFDDVAILGDPIDTKYELDLSNMKQYVLSIFQIICLYGRHDDINLFKFR